TPGSGQGKYLPARSIVIPAEPATESGVVITREDLALLSEGPPASRFTARCHLFTGVAVSCALGAISVVAARNFFTVASRSRAANSASAQALPLPSQG